MFVALDNVNCLESRFKDDRHFGSFGRGHRQEERR